MVDTVALDRAVPPRTTARQVRNTDGEIPTSAATCISGRPLLSSSATASRLNSGENSLLDFGIEHLHALTGLAKVSTESRDHQLPSGALSGLAEAKQAAEKLLCSRNVSESERVQSRFKPGTSDAFSAAC